MPAAIEATEENVLTKEILLSMSDRELNDSLGNLSRKIRMFRKNGKDTKVLEVEYCYLEDECQRRAAYGRNFASRNLYKKRTR